MASASSHEIIVSRSSNTLFWYTCKSVVSKPAIASPDYGLCTRLDASDLGAGGYLFQHDHKPASCVKAAYVPEECICQERIVRYVSKAFKRSMLIMPTFYKEAKAVVLVLSSCRYYIDNSPFCVHVFGDHCPLKWIHTCMKGPVSSWMNVELAGIYFKYHYFPGPRNVIADALAVSRWCRARSLVFTVRRRFGLPFLTDFPHGAALLSLCGCMLARTRKRLNAGFKLGAFPRMPFVFRPM